MSFFGTFGLVFSIFIGLLFAILLLLRIAKYGTPLGSLASTLQGGIPIIDKAGRGDIAEVVGWQQHPVTKMIRLRLNYIDKFAEGQTGYIFKEEDFDPNLSQIDWQHYAGTIICFYDFERNRDFRDTATLNLSRQVMQLKNQIIIYKRMGKDLLEHFEKKKVTEAKEGQNIFNAKALKTLKSLVEEQNVEEVKPGGGDDDMFD